MSKILKIGSVDFSEFVTGMKISYTVLLADSSGLNARGTKVIDIVSRKKTLECSFKSMNDTEMNSLLRALENYSVTLFYRDSQEGNLVKIEASVSTASPEYYRLSEGSISYHPFALTFSEL